MRLIFCHRRATSLRVLPFLAATLRAYKLILLLFLWLRTLLELLFDTCLQSLQQQIWLNVFGIADFHGLRLDLTYKTTQSHSESNPMENVNNRDHIDMDQKLYEILKIQILLCRL